MVGLKQRFNYFSDVGMIFLISYLFILYVRYFKERINSVQILDRNVRQEFGEITGRKSYLNKMLKWNAVIMW